VTGHSDQDFPWGSESAEDLIEQGPDGPGPGWPGRSRWSPRWRRPSGRAGQVTAGLAAAALVVGLAGGYLGGYRVGEAHGRSQVPKPKAPTGPTLTSFGLSETGSQCSTQIGRDLQVGIEVVNGTTESMQLGQLTAQFPRGGLKVAGSDWGPCGTLPYARTPIDGTLPAGASTWLTVTVTPTGKCPNGLPIEYVASYNQDGQTFTVVLEGFADLVGVKVSGCPAS
jgi:hypothetical protein